MSIVRVRGSSWDTQDNLVVDTIPELYKAREEGIIFVAGNMRINDGHGGWFRWDGTIPRTNSDNYNIVDPTGTGAGRGCWVRMKYTTTPADQVESEIQKAMAGQDIFKLNSIRYSPNTGSISVYVNGTRLTPYSFTQIDSETIQINIPLRANDVVEFLHLDNPVGGGNLVVNAQQVEFDPTGTIFTLSDTVQEALQQASVAFQQIGGGTGVGGGSGLIIDASGLPYKAFAPDASNNVQDGMWWIQRLATQHIQKQLGAHSAGAISFDPINFDNPTVTDVQEALNDLAHRIGTGDAISISFDNSKTPLLPDNVQTAIAGLYYRLEGDKEDLQNHLIDDHAAHKATAIFFSSILPRFAGLNNIQEALIKLSNDLDDHEMVADNVRYDQTHYPLGETVQLALTHLKTDINDHVDMPGNAHQASAIGFQSTTSLASTNVQAALEDLEANLEAHRYSNTAAHDASAINFHPINNPYKASDVEGAILEVMELFPGRARYRGGIRIDQPISSFAPYNTLANNDYATVIVGGTIHNEWLPLVTGMPPGQSILEAGDKLIWDGSKFWYIEGSLPSDVVVKNPLPGISQTIIAPGPNNAALRLANVADMTVPTFEVFGDSRIHGIVEDGYGNLRQNAQEVSFNPASSELNSGTVQQALEEVMLREKYHIAGSRSDLRHQADAISFRPVLGIHGLDVQSAIRDVAQMLDQHKTRSAQHKAADITFDNTGLGIPANTVQGVLALSIKEQENHKTSNGAHTAKSISFDNTITGIAATNLQDAVDKLIGLTAGTVVDGGMF